MIKIFKNIITECPFTLYEKQTIQYSAMTQYILELYSKQTNENVLLSLPLSADTSVNKTRYNRFPINIGSYTGSTLMGGEYNYKVYQTTGDTLTISGLTTNDVLESGLCQIIDPSIDIPILTATTYNNPKNEYIFK